MDEVNDFIAYLKAIGWAEQRPWGEFFETFQPPSTDLEKIQKRMETNLLYYRTNYFMIILVTSLYSLITDLVFAVTVLFLVSLWIYIMQIKKVPIVIRGHMLRKRDKFLLLCGISVLSFLITGTVLTISGLVAICGFIVLLHALFRSKSLKSSFAHIKTNFTMSLTGLPTTVDSDDDDDDDLFNHKHPSNVPGRVSQRPNAQRDAYVKQQEKLRQRFNNAAPKT